MNPLHEYSPAELLAALRDHPQLQGRGRVAIAKSLLSVASVIFRVTEEQLIGIRRSNAISHPRMAAMAALYELGFSLDQVGSFFGNRDHGAVINARKRLPVLCASKRSFEKRVHRFRSIFALPPEPPVYFSQTSVNPGSQAS